MSNNRIYLKNKRTGAQIMLAKYYPSMGWYPYHKDIYERLAALFEENEPDASMFGDNDWYIEYEHTAE